MHITFEEHKLKYITIIVTVHIMNDSNIQPSLLHTEPVLVVSDISETINYWQKVLGFTNKWTWGNPPNHGGVSWQGVFIQFTLNPDLVHLSKGFCIWIKVKQIELLYKLHQQNKAQIIDPLKNKPWGLAEYMVKDNNGHYIIFSGEPLDEKQLNEAEKTTPEVNIVLRRPTAEEFFNLTNAVGWETHKDLTRIQKIISAPVFSVVAEDSETGIAIGSAFIISDNVSFFYIKDVMVHPAWQRKSVGTLIMQELTNWLDENAPENAFTVLICREGLAPFYHQFDFAPIFGMHRPSHRNRE